MSFEPLVALTSVNDLCHSHLVPHYEVDGPIVTYADPKEGRFIMSDQFFDVCARTIPKWTIFEIAKTLLDSSPPLGIK
jgi:hypothetical protein